MLYGLIQLPYSSVPLTDDDIQDCLRKIAITSSINNTVNVTIVYHTEYDDLHYQIMTDDDLYIDQLIEEESFTCYSLNHNGRLLIYILVDYPLIWDDTIAVTIRQLIDNSDEEVGLPLVVYDVDDDTINRTYEEVETGVYYLLPNSNLKERDLYVQYNNGYCRIVDSYVVSMWPSPIRATLKQYDSVWYTNDRILTGEEALTIENTLEQSNENYITYHNIRYRVIISDHDNPSTVTLSSSYNTIHCSRLLDVMYQLMLPHRWDVKFRQFFKTSIEYGLSDILQSLPVDIGRQYNRMLQQLQYTVPRIGVIDYCICHHYIGDRSEVWLRLTDRRIV